MYKDSATVPIIYSLYWSAACCYGIKNRSPEMLPSTKTKASFARASEGKQPRQCQSVLEVTLVCITLTVTNEFFINTCQMHNAMFECVTYINSSEPFCVLESHGCLSILWSILASCDANSLAILYQEQTLRNQLQNNKQNPHHLPHNFPLGEQFVILFLEMCNEIGRSICKHSQKQTWPTTNRYYCCK